MGNSNIHNDDPVQIAEYLMNEHGERGALNAAVTGALEAQRSGDNYRHSIWRDVKPLLAQQRIAGTLHCPSSKSLGQLIA